MLLPSLSFLLFFFNDTATTEIYTLSLHDALPISVCSSSVGSSACPVMRNSVRNNPTPSARCSCAGLISRSEEHTSELQSPCNLVCRLLLEKKKKKDIQHLECENRRDNIHHVTVRH